MIIKSELRNQKAQWEKGEMVTSEDRNERERKTLLQLTCDYDAEFSDCCGEKDKAMHYTVFGHY